jgi:hypothetical protein
MREELGARPSESLPLLVARVASYPLPQGVTNPPTDGWGNVVGRQLSRELDDLSVGARQRFARGAALPMALDDSSELGIE